MSLALKQDPSHPAQRAISSGWRQVGPLRCFPLREGYSWATWASVIQSIALLRCCSCDWWSGKAKSHHFRKSHKGGWSGSESINHRILIYVYFNHGNACGYHCTSDSFRRAIEAGNCFSLFPLPLAMNLCVQVQVQVVMLVSPSHNRSWSGSYKYRWNTRSKNSLIADTSVKFSTLERARHLYSTNRISYADQVGPLVEFKKSPETKSDVVAVTTVTLRWSAGFVNPRVWRVLFSLFCSCTLEASKKSCMYCTSTRTLSWSRRVNMKKIHRYLFTAVYLIREYNPQSSRAQREYQVRKRV